MTVAVVGSSGLIGSALVERLAASGESVVRLLRPTSRDLGQAASSSGGRVRSVAWDPASGREAHRALGDVGPIDAIVNVAGAGIGDRRWSARRRAELRDSRILTTRAVVDLVGSLDPAPRTLVSASAVGFYGDRGDEPLTESSTVGDGFLAELCADWERAAAPAADTGVRTVVVRSGIVLAPRGGALGRQVPLFRFGLGGRLGPGTQYRSWISLEDEVAALLRCLEDERVVGPVNLTAPHPVTDADFAAALGRALHRPARLTVPSAALRAVFGAQMAEEFLLASQRAVPEKLAAHGFAFAHPHLDQALRWAVGSAGTLSRP